MIYSLPMTEQFDNLAKIFLADSLLLFEKIFLKILQAICRTAIFKSQTFSIIISSIFLTFSVI